MRVNPPLAGTVAFGVDSYDHALGAKSLRSLGDEFGALERRGVHADLVGSRTKHDSEILHAANSSPDRERHEALLGCAFYHRHHRRATIARSGDIQKYQLIRALGVIHFRALDGIARVAQVQEFRSLHHATIGHIEAGNHSFGQHATIHAACAPEIETKIQQVSENGLPALFLDS